MFTGLVEDVGKLVRHERLPDAAELTIATGLGIDAQALGLGDSIACDGCCLTVTARKAGEFQVLAGPETLARTTLGNWRVGVRVNLERALLPTTRLGGHIVAGHIDDVGSILAKEPVGPAIHLRFGAPPALLRYIVAKGSIAVDGISLTVNRVDDTSFAVGLIPHTLLHTSLGDKAVGAAVNLEVDIVGKYVEKLLTGHLEPSKP